MQHHRTAAGRGRAADRSPLRRSEGGDAVGIRRARVYTVRGESATGFAL